MTYKELLDKLRSLDENQLNMDLCILDEMHDEIYIGEFCENYDHDEGDIILVMKNG